MQRWHRLAMMALVLLVAGGCAQSSLPGSQAAGQVHPLAKVEPLQARFTKAANGVINDRATGLEWYVGPHQDNNWHEAKAWAENLTVAGGGWRQPEMKELKSLYQPGAGPNNMDPIFQTTAAWAWSGQLNHPWSAWGLAFYNGLEGWHSMNYAYGRMALAVRSRR